MLVFIQTTVSMLLIAIISNVVAKSFKYAAAMISKIWLDSNIIFKNVLNFVYIWQSIKDCSH